jgi:hypothetical protein
MAAEPTNADKLRTAKTIHLAMVSRAGMLAALVLCLAGPARMAFGQVNSQVFPLQSDAEQHHVVFNGLPPTVYDISDGVLHAKVDHSASFMLVPFDHVLPVRSVAWEWQGTGGPGLTSTQHEESKSGDDAQLRIGLVIQGEEPSNFQFLLPVWIKQVRTYLKPETTNAMLLLISGGQHGDGQTWLSPYSDTITHMAVDSTPGPGGWNTSSVTLAETRNVIAVWLMADGDDTGSKFETRLRSLQLTSQ